MAVRFAKWEHSAPGMLKLHSVVAVESAVIEGINAAIRFEYVTSDEELNAVRTKQAQPQYLQIVLRSAQARNIAQQPLRMADEIERTSPGNPN